MLDPQQFPTESSEFHLTGPAGRLECLVDVPEPGSERPATAVLCHPHPQHGGTLRNKVVTIMERSLRELGLATVRFNFRGVGESEGEYDNGQGETDDLLAVVEWVQQTRPGTDLWLSGFSFGAYVALKAARDLPVRQLITVAPPVERYGFEELLPPNCPWLVVQGDEDDVVSAEAVSKWAKDLDQPPDLVVMEGAGHFFHRRLMDLRGLIKNHVQSNLPG
ncbi:alpha/beta hydrolase [Wenzhouxiangella limi]|uniref:Alpha/beta hydrolase n=1 Tax=Wenzhouxiangella limi TaxID=2707351 RepID=A0A845V0Q8_9GAMM|nr:alpha/beta fold hydrolase [Wenzhouxiangella limi]NDY95800.1 alpha/beta hydrolase [Wenzhouxiangella limi]